MVAGAVAENKCALELDSRLLLCERRSYGREHVHFTLAIRGLGQAFAETGKIPGDNDHTAIEVEDLTAQREKLAWTEPREDQRREDRVCLFATERSAFISSSISGSTAGLRSRSFSTQATGFSETSFRLCAVTNIE